MSEHLSSLELDEASIAETPPAHLASCAECQQKVEQRRSAAAVFLSQPRAKAVGAQLVEKHGLKRSSPRWWLAVAPLAAGLVLFFAWPRTPPPEPVDRVKGSAMLLLLDGQGQPVTSAHPGEELVLAVRVAAPPNTPVRVQVVTVDAQGTRDPIFGGPVNANERADLMKLVVTPGDVKLQADFQVGDAHQTAELALEVK